MCQHMDEIPNDTFPGDLIPEKSIAAETRKKLSQYRHITVPPGRQSGYETDGWVLDRKLKRSVVMRRTKPHDAFFEDRVWAAMAKLQFKYLNKSRTSIPRIPGSAEEGREFNVFAADDEVALVFECRSTQTPASSTFRQEIDTIQQARSHVIRQLKNTFPDRKVKFVLADQ